MNKKRLESHFMGLIGEQTMVLPEKNESGFLKKKKVET